MSTQVTLEPAHGETIVRVEERLADRLKYILHFIPGTYALFIGGVIGLEMGLGVLPAILLGLSSGILGGSAGGGIWRILSARSGKRIRSLVSKLTTAAAETLETPPQETTD
ncbi:hypothetical protein ACFL27_13185 [candidate division CSSED10-310 bacterium]|uniref:Uncharacterized protein n=1 Tax=candidate division CSSED10-310 bacterium TaxID=2855610 RepID=A0ABV6YY88_UNCC1